MSFSAYTVPIIRRKNISALCFIATNVVYIYYKAMAEVDGSNG